MYDRNTCPYSWNVPQSRAVLSVPLTHATFLCIYNWERGECTSIFSYRYRKCFQFYVLFIPKGNLDFFFFFILHIPTKAQLLKKSYWQVFSYIFFSCFLKCFIDSRENNQIGAISYTPVWLFPDVQRVVSLLTNWSRGIWLMNQHLSPR